MKTRILTLILLLCVCGPLAALAQASAAAPPAANDIGDLAPPEHPATEDQIREYLTLTNAVELAHKIMSASIKSSRATSAPYFTSSFWDDMEAAVMQIDIVGPCIPAYQRYFSQEDMATTITFYKSPAGKRLLASQPFIGSALSDVLRKAGADAGRQVGLKHKDEIERLMKASQSPATTQSPN